LLDAYFHYHESGVERHSLSKGAFKPTRTGLHSSYATPVGVFKGRERYILIMATLYSIG
jgi:hypothetical protein